MKTRLKRKDFIHAASFLGVGFVAGFSSTACKSDYSLSQIVKKTESRNKDNHENPLTLPWDKVHILEVIKKRAEFEKSRLEMDVNYYRIGYNIAFQLPVKERPVQKVMPKVLEGGYPWPTWLLWDLENRWRILNEAWRKFGDKEAGSLLQRELSALSEWDQFVEIKNQVTLFTSHIASSFSFALANTSGWDPVFLQRCKNTAELLLERDIWPWFNENWNNINDILPNQLHNGSLIGLSRTSRLASVLSSPRAEVIQNKMVEILRTYCRFRTGKEYHTEGTAYDGYAMDSVTEWIASLTYREELLPECHDAFRSLADQWIDLTVPGRTELHAPIGDVEPEMMFWTSAIMRLAGWYNWRDAAWILSGINLDKTPIATLSAALEYPGLFKDPPYEPHAGPKEHPCAVSLRTGWNKDDVAAIVSLPRNKMSHLQYDGGHVVLGWQGRLWITDPGYRQYRPGSEQDYTIGTEAHNCPVINGKAQDVPSAILLKVDFDECGWQHTSIDLSRCYSFMCEGMVVKREVWIEPVKGLTVVVGDRFYIPGPDIEIRTHWLGDTQLAWSFVKGWVRLSHSKMTLWMGIPGDHLTASGLYRHPGSRGPLTFAHKAVMPAGCGMTWWVFWFDPDSSWSPPLISTRINSLIIDNPRQPENNRSFTQEDNF